MKLYLIAEGIHRSTFYDFYSLANDYLDHYTGPPEREREVQQRLERTARQIFEDHMNQLAYILATRWLDSNPIPADATHDISHYYLPNSVLPPEKNPPGTISGNLHIYKKYRIGLEEKNGFTHTWLEPNKQDVLRLPRQKQISLIRDLIGTPRNQAYHSVTGETWKSLANAFTKLVRTNTSNLRSLIQAIDRIYGLLHHGGSITDYFDEKAWIKQALDTRAEAEPRELLSQTSPDVRDLLVTSTGIPMQPRDYAKPV